jgi:hypothetical protein
VTQDSSEDTFTYDRQERPSSSARERAPCATATTLSSPGPNDSGNDRAKKELGGGSIPDDV